MTPGARLGAAFRRIGAAVGAKLVRADDSERLDVHGGGSHELCERLDTFASEVEARALAVEKGLG